MSLRDYCVLSLNAIKAAKTEEYQDSHSALKTVRSLLKDSMRANQVQDVALSDSLRASLHHPLVRPKIKTLDDFLEFTKDLDDELREVPLHELGKVVPRIIRQRLRDASQKKEEPQLQIRKVAVSRPLPPAPSAVTHLATNLCEVYQTHQENASHSKELRKQAKAKQDTVLSTITKPLVVRMQQGGSTTEYQIVKKTKSSISIRELMRGVQACIAQLKTRDNISHSIQQFLQSYTIENETSHLSMKPLK